ncbi:hypothetical protein, partial [Tatumella ptyseos]|uniref:hypothetical protein n=1 Tax=Tatumella ptyseos TaxID=82987 RepID=UPI001B80C363
MIKIALLMNKTTHSAGLLPVKHEISPLSNLFEINPCQKKLSPYNALPLTRQSAIRSDVTGTEAIRSGRKNHEIVVD